MKAKALVVLVIAGIWGVGSWWWYACHIKGFCGAPVHAENAHNTTTSEAASQTANLPATETTQLTPAANTEVKPTDTPATETTQLTLAANTEAKPTDTPSADPQLTAMTTATASPTETTSTAEVKEQPQPTKPATIETTPELKPAETVALTTPESSEPAKEDSTTIDPSPPTEPVITNIDDSDKDGISNELEKKLGLDPYMTDSDKDGVSDPDELGDKPTEAPLDTDDDGTINALDTDDDGDGDLTANEVVDPNRDGSIADARDSDQDATPDYLDKDSGWATLDDDHDGITNGEEKEAGTNPSLTDSDGDGVPDSLELADKKDTDEDGVLDALDTDDDNDGIMTAMENPDANNDGKLDDAADHNKNGVPDYLDANSSGETVAQNNNTAEPDPKDPDMATGKPATETTANTDVEPEAEPAANPTEASEQTEAQAAVATEEAEKQATAKTDDTNKITVDLDRPSADKKNVSSARLYFPFRSTRPELADSTAAYFDDLISFLKANPKATVKVIGHTDNVGDAEINEKLGLQRAERIRTQLVRRGAPADRVEASSRGESAPWVSNKTEEGRNKNRRVEVKPIK